MNFTYLWNDLSDTVGNIFTDLSNIKKERHNIKLFVESNENYEFISKNNRLNFNPVQKNDEKQVTQIIVDKYNKTNEPVINQYLKIKNNITNYKPLTTNQLSYLENCLEKEKMEIITLMNKYIHSNKPKIVEVDQTYYTDGIKYNLEIFLDIVRSTSGEVKSELSNILVRLCKKPSSANL